jgi:hypothetical protein
MECKPRMSVVRPARLPQIRCGVFCLVDCKLECGRVEQLNVCASSPLLKTVLLHVLVEVLIPVLAGRAKIAAFRVHGTLSSIRSDHLCATVQYKADRTLHHAGHAPPPPPPIICHHPQPARTPIHPAFMLHRPPSHHLHQHHHHQARPSCSKTRAIRPAPARHWNRRLQGQPPAASHAPPAAACRAHGKPRQRSARWRMPPARRACACARGWGGQMLRFCCGLESPAQPALRTRSQWCPGFVHGRCQLITLMMTRWHMHAGQANPIALALPTRASPHLQHMRFQQPADHASCRLLLLRLLAPLPLQGPRRRPCQPRAHDSLP